MVSKKSVEELYRVDGAKKIQLDRISPDDKGAFKSRKSAEEQTGDDIKAIDMLQDRLYAESRQALLVVLQAMDTGGKDGVVRRIFGQVDPLGVRVVGFKKPTPEELAHDFLWRVHRQVPGKGEIVVFNRSHYEDVLVVRVRGLADPDTIERRYEQINQFEKLLTDTGVTIVKFFLHISKEEQRERLQERVDIPHKRWKFNEGDLEERKLWDDYMKAYEIVLDRCSTSWAPWHVIPANRNWYRNALAARIIRSTLERMDPQYPSPNFDPATIKVI